MCHLIIVALEVGEEAGRVTFTWRAAPGSSLAQTEPLCLTLPGPHQLQGIAILAGLQPVYPSQLACLQPAAAQLGRRLARVSRPASGSALVAWPAVPRRALPRPPRHPVPDTAVPPLAEPVPAELAHALRSPLTAIRGFAALLLQPGVTWPPEQQREFLQIIQQEAEQLQQAVNTLLQNSRRLERERRGQRGVEWRG